MPTYKKLSKEEIENIMSLHWKWLNKEPDGIRADFTGADLSGACMFQVNLTKAILRNVNLCGTLLYETNLTRADLTGANFKKAAVFGLNLTKANLTGTNFTDANFSNPDGDD